MIRAAADAIMSWVELNWIENYHHSFFNHVRPCDIADALLHIQSHIQSAYQPGEYNEHHRKKIEEKNEISLESEL